MTTPFCSKSLLFVVINSLNFHLQGSAHEYSHQSGQPVVQVSQSCGSHEQVFTHHRENSTTHCTWFLQYWCKGKAKSMVLLLLQHSKALHMSNVWIEHMWCYISEWDSGIAFGPNVSIYYCQCFIANQRRKKAVIFVPTCIHHSLCFHLAVVQLPPNTHLLISQSLFHVTM